MLVDKFSGSELPNKVRMIVLETDEPDPGTSREKGSFGDVLNTLLKTAGVKHDPPLGIETVMRFVVEPKGGQVPTMEELQGVHAVLITGSMYDAHGNDEWILKLIKLLQGRVVDSSHDVWRLIKNKICGNTVPICASREFASVTKSSVECSGPRLKQSPEEDGSFLTLILT